MQEPTGTHPFAPFEWMLSLRYLRARRKEGFISVIAGFSFVGIMLGVATLIIVMAVMNGFRQELLQKILGLNGHLLIQPLESPLTDWQALADRISKVPGIRLAAPIVEGQALASSPFNASAPAISPGCPRSPRTSNRARSTASTKGRASPSAAGSPSSCRCAPATISRWWRRAAR
jgi:ABC-type lipoprotein release transport system permease subunit